MEELEQIIEKKFRIEYKMLDMQRRIINIDRDNEHVFSLDIPINIYIYVYINKTGKLHKSFYFEYEGKRNYDFTNTLKTYLK